MKDPEITAAYDRLAQMTVHLQQDPTYGPLYLQEKLLEARKFQDEATNILVAVNRGWSNLRQEVLAQRLATRTAQGPDEALERYKLDALLEQLDRLKFLKEATNVRRNNLTRTASDVRLLLDCIKVGLQGGGGTDAPDPNAPALPSSGAAPDDGTAGALDQFYAAEEAEPGAQTVTVPPGLVETATTSLADQLFGPGSAAPVVEPAAVVEAGPEDFFPAEPVAPAPPRNLSDLESLFIQEEEPIL